MNSIMDTNRKELNEHTEYKVLKGIIQEELGISDEVKILANRLARQISEEYHPGYTINVTPFSKKCGEYVIRVDLKDYKSTREAKAYVAEYKGITYFSYRVIMILGYTINGKVPMDKLSEVLQHELKHVFDLYKSGSDRFFKQNTDMETYKTAAEQATNKNLPREQIAVGYAIYLSYKFENQAFESGTYAYLMNQDLPFIGSEVEAVKNTMYFKRLMLVKYAHEFIRENEDEARSIAESIYGKTLGWLKKTVSASLKDTRRQIGRAVAKVRKDYDWTHGGKSTVWA